MIFSGSLSISEIENDKPDITIQTKIKKSKNKNPSIKFFIANMFSIRSNNPNKSGKLKKEKQFIEEKRGCIY